MLYLLLILICMVFLWRIMNKKKNSVNPPFFSGKLPIIGHAHQFFFFDTWHFIKKICIESMQKGGSVTLRFGLRTVYAVTDPDDCLKISNACLEKDQIYKFAKPFVGNSLVTADVSTWKVHRKLLNPAFNQQVLNSFIGVFNSQSRRLVSQLKAEVGNDINIQKFLQSNNLETICLTSIGIPPEKFNGLYAQYLKYTAKYLVTMILRFKKLWYHNEFLYSLSSLKEQQDKIVAKALRLSDLIVHSKKTEMETAQYATQMENRQGKLKPFLNLIIELANNTGCFTDNEIREQTASIIFAGHDNSALTLTYAFVLLGTYPHIQQKVYDEILEVVGTQDRDLNNEDISKLVYIDAVLKETLRLYPITSIVGRTIDREIKLEKYTLNANSGCILGIWGMHRSPKWGPDAEQFRPERWFEPTVPTNYFGGFGLGRRSCIGKMFAMMSMKTAVAHVIRRYYISADASKLKLVFEILLKPVSGHHVTLKIRE